MKIHVFRNVKTYMSMRRLFWRIIALKFPSKVLLLLVSLNICFILVVQLWIGYLDLVLEVSVPILKIVTYLTEKVIFDYTLLRHNLWPTSQCSKRDRGSAQKVIAFTLFENDNNLAEVVHFYVPGIIENLKQIRKIYPGWVMRLYTNLPKDEPYLEVLQNDNETDMFICNTTNLPGLGNVTAVDPMVWRFLPIGDPTVDIFMSRDLDSVVSPREQSAVAEWENSNKTFHTMRDSPYHIASVMGGIWGAKNYLMSDVMRLTLQNRFIQGGIRYRQIGKDDQHLLDVIIYRPFKHLFIAHDSYQCLTFNNSLPFPKEREHPMRFVGMKYIEFGVYDPFQCPVACRPSYGKNWYFC